MIARAPALFLRLSVLLAAAWIVSPARATTIDPLTWEELVASADMLGVVECVTAGGIVAKYSVLDSWKGPGAGQEVAIRTAVNAWEPQFPIALCGQRFLVAAYKRPPSTMMSTTGYGPVPLWWRNLPADYETPLFQGVCRLPMAGSMPLNSFGSEKTSLEDFKESALALLALPPEKREARLLQAQASKYLQRMEPEEKSESLDALREKLAESSNPEEIVRFLLAGAQDGDDQMKRLVSRILARGGGSTTLKTVEKLPADGPFEQGQKERITRSIRARLEDPASTPEPSPAERTPSKGKVEKLCERLEKAKPGDRDIGEAIEVLTVQEPAVVAAYLVKWVNPEKDWWDHDSGYPLGSYFAWRCGKDREANLRTLLKAHDPWIRVAGAVYLFFEDREAGIRELQRLQSLEGDPGVWAALNLARRGDRSAMDRVLEVFATPGKSNMEGVPHRNLQKRVLVLLSNSAKQSGLPQLVLESETEPTFFKKWWTENAAHLTLFDPWRAPLEKQKVD